ncbi:MAG: hypothetical protein J6Q30_04090 [Oscillospiraceae bacterium]|nr:hypothetical protein [Oscillospiraceae bacterium]
MENNIWDILVDFAENDKQYQEALDRVKRLEPAFLAIRKSLSPEQQRILDDYIAACEALDQCQTFLAANLSFYEENHPAEN